MHRNSSVLLTLAYLYSHWRKFEKRLKSNSTVAFAETKNTKRRFMGTIVQSAASFQIAMDAFVQERLRGMTAYKRVERAEELKDELARTRGIPDTDRKRFERELNYIIEVSTPAVPKASSWIFDHPRSPILSGIRDLFALYIFYETLKFPYNSGRI